MAFSLNEAVLGGTLGRDPEMKYGQDGKAITTLSVAIGKKKNREGQEETIWVGLVAFGKTAETIFQYLHKGDNAIFHSAFNGARAYEKDGEPRAAVEFIVNRVTFVPGNKRVEAEAEVEEAPAPTPIRQAAATASRAAVPAGRAPAGRVVAKPAKSTQDDDLPF